jgi:hypothetical protein
MHILACPGFDSVTDFFSSCDNLRDLNKEKLTLHVLN